MRTIAKAALALLVAMVAWSAHRLELHLRSTAEKVPALQGKNDKAAVAPAEKDIELRPENFAAVFTRAQELARLP